MKSEAERKLRAEIKYVRMCIRADKRTERDLIRRLDSILGESEQC